MDWVPEFEALERELVPTGWAGPAVLSQGDLRCPPGSWGTGKATLSTLLSCSPGTQFHRSAEFGGFLVSQRVAMVMITILQGGEHHPPCVSSGKGLASGELGDAADGVCQLLSSCSEHLPANKTFK